MRGWRSDDSGILLPKGRLAIVHCAVDRVTSLLNIAARALHCCRGVNLVRPRIGRSANCHCCAIASAQQFGLYERLQTTRLSLRRYQRLVNTPAIRRDSTVFGRRVTRLQHERILSRLTVHFLRRGQRRCHALRRGTKHV